MSIISEWNVKQKRLKEIIKKSTGFEEAKELFLSLHKAVHSSEIGLVQYHSIFDDIWDGLEKKDFEIMPTIKDVTIAWNIWHITRIEDITINRLVNDSEQVLDTDWLHRLNVIVTDTGNAMTDDEIILLSKSLNIDQLKNYRNAVGKRAQTILNSLTADDMKRKIKKESIDKVLSEGGVLEHPDSIWLLDFWGKKDVAGIILMPITRHQIVHLNDCVKIKNAIKRKRIFYR